MAGTSRSAIESFYGELSGNIASGWGEDVMATLDDKLHMSEQTSVQTVQGPVNWSVTGSVHTFASPVNISATAINTFAGPVNATSTGTNTWAGPMDFNNTVDVQGVATFQTQIVLPNSNNITSLVTAEISQLANIGTTTISAAQWGYLGAMNQGVSQSASVTFAAVKVVNNIQEFSTDTTLAGNSNTALPTEKAVKTYADLRALWNSDNSPAVTRHRSYDALHICAHTIKLGGGDQWFWGTWSVSHAQSNGTGVGYMGIQLPHGCTVTAFRIYNHKYDAQEAMTVTLVRYTVTTDTSDTMASVDVTVGYSNDSDESISYAVIDNTTYTYHIKFNHTAHDDDYCQVRRITIEYTVVRPQP